MLTNDRDHFDQKVEASLQRDLPIVTTSHTHAQLTNKDTDSFTNISALNAFQSIMVDIRPHILLGRCQLRITAIPGKHIPSNSVVEGLNSKVQAISAKITTLPLYHKLIIYTGSSDTWLDT